MKTPSPGILLIAEPFLKDPSFKRSVVLLCSHLKDEGTFGFALNKTRNLTLDLVIPEMTGYPIPVFEGGPVQTDTLHYLHQYPEYFPDALKITEGVYWGGNFEEMKALIKNGSLDPAKIKFFLGYSGWSTGQLDAEMQQESWLTVDATEGIIFGTSANEVWNASLTLLGGKYKMLIHYPTDPQLN